MKKFLALTLALLAVPALAVASPEIAVHQTQAPTLPMISVPSHSLRARMVVDEFRVGWIARTAHTIRLTLINLSGQKVVVIQPRGASRDLRDGEYVYLKVAALRGRP